MKYHVNALPVKTTNHFHINDLELSLELPEFQMKDDFQITGDISSLHIKKEVKNKSITSKIGLTFPKYYEITITVPKDSMTQDIVISYSFKNKDSLICKWKIIYEENSSCNFCFNLTSKDSSSCFLHFQEEVIMKENSKGKIVFTNLLNSQSKCFYALENQVSNSSYLSHTIIDLGGDTRVYNAYGESIGYSSQNILNTIYIGKRKEVLDFQYYYKNIGENSLNKIQVEGAIDDYSKKCFRGTIDFIENCKSSIGEENENCILLSDTCISRSLPQMLCHEEDVVGSHGVSSGKVSPEKLFYLQAKGYSEKEAEKFIIMGNFSHILKEIPSSIQEEVLSKIEDLIS